MRQTKCSLGREDVGSVVDSTEIAVLLVRTQNINAVSVKIRRAELVREVKVFDVAFLVVHIVQFMTKVEIRVDVYSAFDAEPPVESPLIPTRRILVHCQRNYFKDVFSPENFGVNPRIEFRRAVVQEIDIRIFGNERTLTIPTQKTSAVQPG